MLYGRGILPPIPMFDVVLMTVAITAMLWLQHAESSLTMLACLAIAFIGTAAILFRRADRE